MDNAILRDDFLLFDTDYIMGIDSQFLNYTFQLENTSSSHEKNFQKRIQVLYEYLGGLLNSDDRHISPLFSEEKFPIVTDAKQKFRESSLQILDGIKRSFEDDSRYQLLPDKYLQQTMENTRQHLFISYNKMMQNVANLAQTSSARSTVPIIPPNGLNTIEAAPRQKLKPGKTKFPKKARQILESWYKNHTEDPFPSYAEKVRLAEESGITVKQVKCWFINVRRKHKQELNDDEDFMAQIEKRLILNNGSMISASNSGNTLIHGHI